MKVYIYLNFVVSIVYVAQINGKNLSENSNTMMIDPSTNVKPIKIPFYFTSPDNWLTFFNSISEKGHKCFLDDLNTSAGTFNQSDKIDIEDIKKDLISKCPEYGTFINTVSQPINVVPTTDTFFEAMEDWKNEMVAIEKQLQRALLNKGESNERIIQKSQMQLAKSTASFTKRLTMLSEAERQEFGLIFPKLQFFFTSSDAMKVINKINKLCEYFVSGKIDVSAFKTFVTTPQMMLGQYSSMKSTEVLPNDLMKVIGGIMSQVKTEVGNLGGFQLNVSNRPTFGVLNTTNRPMQESPKNTSDPQQISTPT